MIAKDFIVLDVLKSKLNIIKGDVIKKYKLRNWKPEMTAVEEAVLAYEERNLLALAFANGWYYDKDNDWPGYKRVLSLNNGAMCFHIPDDFPVGNLQQIEPNWDGHDTQQKWSKVLDLRGIKWERS